VSGCTRYHQTSRFPITSGTRIGLSKQVAFQADEVEGVQMPVSFRILAWVIRRPALRWPMTRRLMGLNYSLNWKWIRDGGLA